MADGRKNNGGSRKGAGRKPNLEKKALEEARRCIENHGMQDAGNGLTRIENIYEVLYGLGMEGNYAASKEYLDRQMGRATQKTELTGKDGKDLKVITGFNFLKNKDK